MTKDPTTGGEGTASQNVDFQGPLRHDVRVVELGGLSAASIRLGTVGMDSNNGQGKIVDSGHAPRIPDLVADATL